MSTRNISWGGKGGRCLRLTTLPPSCADCLEIREPQPPGTLRACSGIALPLNLITFYLKESNIFIIICTKEYDNAVVTCQISISNTVDGIAVLVIVVNFFD
jgi:hypothetical protein